jgi:hypothetical protein
MIISVEALEFCAGVRSNWRHDDKLEKKVLRSIPRPSPVHNRRQATGQTVIVHYCHRNKAVTMIAITARAGTTTGGTNQADIGFFWNRPREVQGS